MLNVRHLAATLLASTTLSAVAGPTLCIWDPIGKGGQIFDGARSYALAMQSQGVDLTLKAYTDEAVATADFKVGQCDGLLATSIRTKVWVPTPAALDNGGAATVVRNGKIDMDASYEVIRKAMQVLASPAAEKFSVQDKFEVAGIVPTGALYTFVRDRDIFKKGFSGVRMPAFDNDKLQALLIARAGATPVAANIRNFVTLFNNGNTDVVFAPAVAYFPLEINKGVGTKGGVSRFPLAFTSLQLVINREKFPAGFGQKSRQHWVGQFDAVTASVRKAEAGIPAPVWVDYDDQEAANFVAMQRDSRIALAKEGYYDKAGLKLMKRVRCSVNPTATDCANNSEIDW